MSIEILFEPNIHKVDIRKLENSKSRTIETKVTISPFRVEDKTMDVEVLYFFMIRVIKVIKVKFKDSPKAKAMRETVFKLEGLF